MNFHFRILGWLYIVMGTISLVASVWFFYALHSSGPLTMSPDTQQILMSAGYGTVLLGILVIASLGTLFTGYALLRMHRYAKFLAGFFAILGLFDFPLGTMLGVYTLWVITRKEEKPIVLPELGRTPASL